MKTTNAKKIELRGAGVCKIEDDVLTISGIELDIKETENALVVDGNNICIVAGNGCLVVGDNNVVGSDNTIIVGMQNCVVEKAINVGMNITIINDGKRVDYRNVELNCSNEKAETLTEQYKLNNELKELKISGSGDMIVDTDLFDSNEIYIQVKGSGDFEIKNLKSENVYIEVMGSGDVYVKNLVAKNLTVTLKGSGDVNIKYAQAYVLKASLIGSGDIDIVGNIKNVFQKTVGSGDLEVTII